MARPRVFSYIRLFIETPSVFTTESMKNRKSLELHNQFISCWVRTVYQYQKIGSDFMILKPEVMPSQRLNENPHLPWVAKKLRGITVETAHCTCMAGLHVWQVAGSGSDNGKAALTIRQLTNHLINLKIDILDNRNITGKHLNRRGLHLNQSGSNLSAKNIISKLRKF